MNSLSCAEAVERFVTEYRERLLAEEFGMIRLDSAWDEWLEVFIRLCSIGAVSFVMVHNHPSGDTSPSEEDRRFARTLKEAGSIIGIDLQDFLIIGGSEDESYYSFKEKSVL